MATAFRIHEDMDYSNGKENPQSVGKPNVSDKEKRRLVFANLNNHSNDSQKLGTQKAAFHILSDAPVTTINRANNENANEQLKTVCVKVAQSKSSDELGGTPNSYCIR